MRILLFDIDGTLINTGGAGGTALLEAFRDEFEVARPQAVPFSGRTDRAIGSHLFQLHGIDDTAEHWERLRAGYLSRLPLHLPRCRGRVLAGVSELLDRLGRQEQTLLGLLTGNVREGARIKLSHYGLSHHFSFGGFGDEHYDRDQVAAVAFREAHQRLNGNAPAEATWVLGDTPLDVRCARAIGAKVLAVATGLHSVTELAQEYPDALLDDLSDTDRVLELLI